MAANVQYTSSVLGRPTREKSDFLGEELTAAGYTVGTPLRFAGEVFNRPTGTQGDFGRFTSKDGKKEMGNWTALLQNGPFGFGMDGTDPKSSAPDSSNIG